MSPLVAGAHQCSALVAGQSCRRQAFCGPQQSHTWINAQTTRGGVPWGLPHKSATVSRAPARRSAQKQQLGPARKSRADAPSHKDNGQEGRRLQARLDAQLLKASSACTRNRRPSSAPYYPRRSRAATSRAWRGPARARPQLFNPVAAARDAIERKDEPPSATVLSPTRELALQTHKFSQKWASSASVPMVKILANTVGRWRKSRASSTPWRSDRLSSTRRQVA